MTHRLAPRRRFFQMTGIAAFAAFIAALTILAAEAPGQQRPAGPNHARVVTATYLNGHETEADAEVGGVAVGPRGEIVFGGTLPEQGAAGWEGARRVRQTELLEGGDGAIVRLDRTGTRPISITRVGGAVRDLVVGDDGRIVAAVRGHGMIVLDREAGDIVYRDEVENTRRVAVSRSGRVVTLADNRQVRIYDPEGNLLGMRQFRDNYVEDVAIDDRSGNVFVAGFNNRRLTMRNGRRGPVQVGFIRAFALDDLEGDAAWTAYDWPGNPLGAAPGGGRGEGYHLLEADTRIYRLAMGRDGALYFAGEAAGGNAIFERDPQDLDQRVGDKWVRFDAYNTPFNTAANHIAAYGRLHPGTGALDRVQSLLPRLQNNRGNTLRPRGIAADEQGRVYLTGVSTRYMAHRDGMSINGVPVGPPSGGDVFLLITSPDWKSRHTWVAFTAPEGDGSGRGLGIDVRRGLSAFAAETEGQMLTTPRALQRRASGSKDAYLVISPPPGR